MEGLAWGRGIAPVLLIGEETCECATEGVAEIAGALSPELGGGSVTIVDCGSNKRSAREAFHVIIEKVWNKDKWDSMILANSQIRYYTLTSEKNHFQLDPWGLYDFIKITFFVYCYMWLNGQSGYRDFFLLINQ